MQGAAESIAVEAAINPVMTAREIFRSFSTELVRLSSACCFKLTS